MQEIELTLRAYWQHAPISIKALAAKTEAYLKLLKQLQPKFSNLLIRKSGINKILIADDYSNFKELFYKGAYSKDLVYSHLHHDFLTDESAGPFRLTFSNRRSHTKDIFSVTINCFDNKYNKDLCSSFIQIDFPEDDASFFEYEFCQRLLVETAELWQADFAKIYTFGYQKKTNQLPSDYGCFGWLNYFPPERMGALDLVHPDDVESKAYLSGRGGLITLTPHIPDINNPADMSKAFKLRDVLAPAGYLNEPKK